MLLPLLLVLVVLRIFECESSCGGRPKTHIQKMCRALTRETKSELTKGPCKFDDRFRERFRKRYGTVARYAGYYVFRGVSGYAGVF